MIEATDVDNGKTFSVAMGDTLEVRLAESPTTGYRWAICGEASHTRVADDQFVPPASGHGAAGLRVIRFQPTQPGTDHIAICLNRSWESSPGAQRFAIDIT